MTDHASIEKLSPAERRAVLARMLADRQSGQLAGADLPLSFQQERLWFLHKLLPDSSAYNIPASLLLPDYVNRELMERALNRVIERHAILRTSFVETEHGPIQVVQPYLQLELGLVDLSHLAPQEQASASRRRAFEEVAKPFDLARPPLIRAVLLRESALRYYLILSIHHIVFDAWSMELLFKELSAMYMDTTAADLKPLRLQYHDYARRQREPGQIARLGDALERRTACLETAPLILDLPFDRPRPAVQSFNGRVHRFKLSRDLSKRLENWGRRNKATPFMTWLSIFALLLHRLSGRDDFLIGSPVANRPHPELEDLIGLFVNNLVLRIRLDKQADAGRMLAAVRTEVLEAITCQEVPFERLVDALDLERDMSRNPLFQVMFVYQNASAAAGRETRGTVDTQPVGGADEVDTGTSKFDLTLYASTGSDGARFSLEYNTDLFDAATIERWSRDFAWIADRISDTPDAPVSRLFRLSGPDERQIAAWNLTQRCYGGPELLHELVRLQARRCPLAPAVICEARELSYRALDESTDRLAHGLIDLAHGRPEHVAVVMDRSIEMLIAALAVMKAGGTYVPIDPSYPESRVRFMLEDSDARVVIGASAHAPILEQVGVPVFLVDSDLDALPAVSGPPPVEIHPGQGAYMIYTSGSTGRPKGVINSHRAICNRLNWMQETFELQPGERILHKTPISFDVSVWELFWPLMSGATLIPALANNHRDPKFLCRLIDEFEITTAHFVPSMLQAFLDIPDLRIPSSLRRVICSGETLGPALASRFFTRSQAELYNLYGPTEAAIDVTWWPCDRLASLDEPVPIGRPVANTAIYIVDEQLQQVPIGTPGELCIGGAQVASRYHQRPRLTASSFVPDPWSDRPGARMYRTGDRARFRPSGAIEFIGRLDGQIKLRGQRIEIGEIEHALLKVLPVQSAAVVLHEHTHNNKHLVAYLVAELGALLPSERDIRNSLHSILPAAMIPSFFVALERMPLSPSGKIDRGNLARRQLLHADSPREYAVPGTATEAALADIWRQVLDVDPIGVHEDFFELGGHSLLVTQVSYRIQAQLGVEVPIRVMFEGPTIAQIADYVDEAAGREQTESDMSIATAPRRTNLPLSFSQERLWFLNTLVPDSPLYNMPVSLRLSGSLDEAALRAALAGLLDRHEALRTVFGDTDGKPVQTVLESYYPELMLQDWSVLPRERRMSEAVAQCEQFAMLPFDLDRHPPWRCLVQRLTAEEHVLLLSFHHIIADGWSVGILARELHELYSAALQDRQPELEPLVLQFPDFAYWQRTYLQGERLEKLAGYWKQQLCDAPAEVRLALDKPRPLTRSMRGALYSFSLDPRVIADLQRLSRSGQATLFMALMLAFNLLLLRRAGQTDQVIGIPIANRNRPEFEKMVGCFVNTLVMRVDLSGDPCIRDALERVRKVTLAAYEHQDMPFEKLVEYLHPSRDPNRNPLFNVMFAYQNIPFDLQADPDAAGQTREAPATITTHTAKFDLTLFIEGAEEAMRGSIEYDTGLFDQASIEGMVQELKDIFREMGRRPERAISSLLAPGERDLATLEQWSGGQTIEADDRRVEERFAEQLSRRPQAPAIREGERCLSYEQLDRMASDLASRILAAGLRAGDIVAIGLSRRIERVAAILATLRAGGTYLPLDPDDPAERVAYMIEDSGTRLLLCDVDAPSPVDGLEVLRIGEAGTDSAPDLSGSPRSTASLGADQGAYLIYTSGSTGRPKGVAVPHRALAGLLAWQQAEHAPVATTAHLASLGFDVAFQEMFCTLCSGGTLVLPRDDARHDPGLLVEFLRAEKVERLFLPPLALRQLADAVVQEQRFDALRSLRQVFVAGEQLYVTPAIRTLLDRLDRCRFYNQYGPTETHVVTEELVVTTDESAAPAIGRPISNSRAYVLDRHLRPLPIGAVGELCLGGWNLALGYLGRAAETAAQFVPDPFATTPGARMYRTGDRARFLSDGRLLFLGRMDQQLKVRGYRVEPGEIEALLNEQDDIEAAAVLPWHTVESGVQLIAYVAPARGNSLEASELRRRLSLFLPNYMLPTRLFVLDALPLLPSGKLDRVALPAPGSIRRDNSTFVAPRTPLEVELAAIWQELLQLKRVDVHDNFFDLGGHSLVATRVAARIEKQLDIHIPVAALFEHATIESLALHVLGRMLLQDEESFALDLLEEIETRGPPENALANRDEDPIGELR